MNQSKFVTIACNFRKAREKSAYKVRLVSAFQFTTDVTIGTAVSAESKPDGNAVAQFVDTDTIYHWCNCAKRGNRRIFADVIVYIFAHQHTTYLLEAVASNRYI